MSLAADGRGEEFFDQSITSKRFPKVDKIKGAELLEKVEAKQGDSGNGLAPPGSPKTGGFEEGHAKKPSTTLGDFRSRFGDFARRT